MSYRIHYPSLKKLSELNYCDPRSDTTGKRIFVEKEGNFRKGESNIGGHYVIYEDEGFPGSYIGVHVSSEINEDSGEPSVNVVAIDPSRSAVLNRVAYRMRQSKIAENEIASIEENVLTKRMDSINEAYGNRYRDRGPSKADWMRNFEDHAVKLDSSHAGKIDWDTAHHYYFQKHDPKDAAERYVNSRKPKNESIIYESTRPVRFRELTVGDKFKFKDEAPQYAAICLKVSATHYKTDGIKYKMPDKAQLVIKV